MSLMSEDGRGRMINAAQARFARYTRDQRRSLTKEGAFVYGALWATNLHIRMLRREAEKFREEQGEQ